MVFLPPLFDDDAVPNITEPLGLGVRTDGYVYEGYEIPIYYDPMISKLIVWAQTRDEAIQRMKRALYEYKITGVKTSIPFLERIMDTPDFVSGNYDTHFIANNEEMLMQRNDCNQECEDMAIFVAYLDYLDKLKSNATNSVSGNGDTSSSWKEYSKRQNVIRI
jgi:acetyl-CoA carboxylase biotin carboxylase subunit